ncbi:MAG: hypothetical protein J6Q21_03305 [Alistipes sp.]|nr:hypothetical protein [Alistipes sp.]
MKTTKNFEVAVGYAAPEMEIVGVEIERGFEGSDGETEENYGFFGPLFGEENIEW